MMPSIEEGLSLRVRVDLGGFARREWLPRLLVVRGDGWLFGGLDVSTCATHVFSANIESF